MNQHYLTRDKKNELEAELAELKTAKRKDVAEKLAYAKSLGDLTENAEYHEALAELDELEERIARLEHIIKHSELVEEHHSVSVEVGSRVTVRKNGAKEDIAYVIVGSEEADITANKVSNESPLGRALQGRKEGDTVKVETPKGAVSYVIVSIA